MTLPVATPTDWRKLAVDLYLAVNPLISEQNPVLWESGPVCDATFAIWQHRTCECDEYTGSERDKAGRKCCERCGLPLEANPS